MHQIKYVNTVANEIAISYMQIDINAWHTPFTKHTRAFSPSTSIYSHVIKICVQEMSACWCLFSDLLSFWSATLPILSVMVITNIYNVLRERQEVWREARERGREAREGGREARERPHPHWLTGV